MIRLRPTRLLAICGLAVSIYLFNRHLTAEVKLVLDALISGQIIAWAAKEGDSPAGRLLECTPLTRLGDWSYSFYCYSTPFLLIVATYVMERYGVSREPVALVGMLACIVALTLAVALPASCLSYRFVETRSISPRARAPLPVTPAE